MKKVTEFLDRPITLGHALAGLAGIIIALFFFGNTAQAAEFQEGYLYQTTHAQGTVLLTCRGFQNGRFVTMHRTNACYVDYHSPSATSRFTNEGSKAYKVKITNHSNKNKSKTKTFYPDKGESKHFNLLISTLFQRPLLIPGENNLTYQMILKSGEVIESGPYNVISTEEYVHCPIDSVFSSNLSDCTVGPSQALCDQYFYRAGCLR